MLNFANDHFKKPSFVSATRKNIAAKVTKPLGQRTIHSNQFAVPSISSRLSGTTSFKKKIVGTKRPLAIVT